MGDGSYDPLTLVGAMLDGSDVRFHFPRQRRCSVSTAYPFPVTNNTTNQNEGDRKTAKLLWVKELAEDLGFPVVVQRQADKYVYVEIGDPDAPEMIMALSHLDSPTGSVSAAQLDRWRGPDGFIGAASAYLPQCLPYALRQGRLDLRSRNSGRQRSHAGDAPCGKSPDGSGVAA